MFAEKVIAPDRQDQTGPEQRFPHQQQQQRHRREYRHEFAAFGVHGHSDDFHHIHKLAFLS
jgi:hypothetical protein